MGVVATTLLALVSAFAERLHVRIGGRNNVSAGFLADFLAAAALGPLAGAVVAACGATGGYQRGRGQITLNAFNTSAFAIIGGACGLVYAAINPPGLGPPGLALVAAGVAAAAAYQVLNYALLVPFVWFRRRMSPREVLDEVVLPYLPFQVFFLLISVALLYIFESLQKQQQVGVFVVFVLPVVGLVYALRSFARQKELTKSLERFSLQMAASMITALDLKDNYTAQHSAAVAQYSFDLAARLGLAAKSRSLAHLAGLLHDLGKISVPDEVLNSRQDLGKDQWDVIRGHSVAGQRVLTNMHEFEELGLIVLHHHERFDGTGYPQGLSGEEIPIISRIVSVADCYSAMVSNRPYRGKRSPEEAASELKAYSGTQFDPQVVVAFLAVLEGESEQYRRAEHIDFRLQFQKVRFLGDFA